jgi:YggT family protein
VLSISLQIVYLALYCFLLALFTRFTMGAVLTYGRRWRPGRGAAATMEVVWSVTDPPIKALRRLIPPVRVGAAAFDVATLVVFLIVYVLMTFVVPPLIQLTSR